MGRDGPVVLAVEDEGMIAMELADMLEDLGCAVAGPVPTVEDALTLLRATPPDAAIVDVNLAGEPAGPVLEALRAARIPFVLASGYEPTELRALGLGGTLLRKPYSAGDLAGALRAIGVLPDG